MFDLVKLVVELILTTYPYGVGLLSENATVML